MKKTLHPLLLRIAPLAILASPAFAADIVVSPGGSIQAAIDAAHDGDRVLVQAGTYAESIDFAGKQIEVAGVGGPLATVIDANGLGQPCARFWSDEGPASILRGFTLRNGDNANTPVAFGGGVSCLDGGGPSGQVAAPTVEDCIITGCTADWGGGAYTNGVLRRCAIFGNGSPAETNGGGVAGESMQVIDCVLADNDAYEGGGALSYWGGSGVLFQGCVVVGNRAGEGASGGGLELNCPADVVECVIANNAITWGGMTADWGAGVYASVPGVTIAATTIVDNTCTPSFFGPLPGGAVYGPATIVDSILRGNCDTELLDATATYSNVLGTWTGTGNFDADPMFVDAAGGDYHLRAGSPCIDAGDPSGLDPDGTVADVGAHFRQSLYVRDNATSAQWSDPAWSTIAADLGGKIAWRLDGGPALAGSLYAVAGSLTGTSPGLPVLGLTLPLAVDGYFDFSLAHANQPPYAGSLGTLDGAGAANVTFALPPGLPALSGVTVWHAGLVVDLSIPAALLATNPVETTLE